MQRGCIEQGNYCSRDAIVTISCGFPDTLLPVDKLCRLSAIKHDLVETVSYLLSAIYSSYKEVKASNWS